MASIMIRATLLRTAVSVSLVTALVATLLASTFLGQIAGAATGYDLTWETKAPMRSPSNGLAVALGPDGRIYAIAGSPDTVDYFSMVQAYDPSNNSWQVVADIPIERGGLEAVTVDGKLYAVGGYNFGGWLNDVEAYDPSSNTWTQMAPMPTPRYEFGVAAVGGRIYAIAGRNATGWLNIVEEYNPATNTWRARASMPSYRSNLIVVAANNGKIGSGKKVSDE